MLYYGENCFKYYNQESKIQLCTETSMRKFIELNWAIPGGEGELGQ